MYDHYFYRSEMMNSKLLQTTRFPEQCCHQNSGATKTVTLVIAMMGVFVSEDIDKKTHMITAPSSEEHH